MLPPILIELIQSIVGVILDTVIRDLPELQAGLRTCSTSTAIESQGDSTLLGALSAELDSSIAAGQAPATGMGN